MAIFNRVHEEEIKVKNCMYRILTGAVGVHTRIESQAWMADIRTNNFLIAFVGEKTVVTFGAGLIGVSSFMHS